jgi:[ribosomal protein S5]-alanine N-acetyltransferase
MVAQCSCRDSRPRLSGRAKARQRLRSVRAIIDTVVPVLQTRRLLLRPLGLADAAQTQVLFPHWEIVRYLATSVPWPYPPDGALTYYRDVALPAMERGVQWNWTLRLKSNPEQLIGSISLMKGDRINRGFWLGLPWHRQGIMTEACEVVTDYWFNTLKFTVLRAHQRQ